MILIGLRYALVQCHSFKGCALPPSLLFHALFLSPIQAHNVTSTIFWRDNQKIVGLGTKYCIISNPSRYSGLHLPCFLQHVQHQHLPVNPLGLATGTQCLLEVHQLASLQRQLVSGDNICPFRSWPCRPLGPKPLAPFSEGYKHTPGSNLLFTFIEHLICCLLLICS